MASQVLDRLAVQAAPGGVKPYRLTVPQFLEMIDAGIFERDGRVELIGGKLIRMMVEGNPHDNCLSALSEELRAITPAGWIVREDKSLQLDDSSRPEPDIAVVQGPRSKFWDRAPHANETAMVAEVAESSYTIDRGLKWRSYAAAGLPIYWIANLPARRIEVHSGPSGKGKSAGYATSIIYQESDHVPVVIDGREVGRIAVRDILP